MNSTGTIGSCNKVGIYGGTFNPIHNGHIQIALHVNRVLKLDKFYFVPNKVPVHKQLQGNASSDDRLKMCKLATTESCHGFEVCDIEITREQESFTYLTLQWFQKTLPYSELYFILGADSYLTLPSWNESYLIYKLCKFCVIPRNGISFEYLTKLCKKFDELNGSNTFVFNIKIPYSSTQIREKIKKREDISKLVPKVVRNYISSNSLY